MRWLTGLIGLFGVAAVMTYPLRKQIYRRRAGALRYWMLAHVYIGAIAGLVLLLHSGTQTGGLLTTSLYVTFDFVVATGILAIVSYIVAPRVLTSIEGEPLLIEDLVGRQVELRNEFEQIVNKSEGWLRDEIEERVRKRFFGIGFLMRQLYGGNSCGRCWPMPARSLRKQSRARRRMMSAFCYRTPSKPR